ncbi:MAG: DegT/DnrJ/EryC1/StrS family aminotransferase, partial [bacterium]|nr:DegT/DnrJ/EryC1/StrS family aminotransferase [bacterium]
FKLTNIQAAIGLAQLESFAARLEHLRHIFSLYRDYLADVPQVRLPGFDIEGGECPQWVDAIVDNRDDLHDYLLSHNIHTCKFWYPLHTQAPYRTDDDRFPASLQVSTKGLWLPSAFSLDEESVRLVCDRIKDWGCVSLPVEL